MFIGGPVAVFTVVLCGVTEKARKPLENLWSTELLFRAFVESIAGILVVHRFLDHTVKQFDDIFF